MDQLFAPWRIEWVTRDDEADEGCAFCTLPDRENGREALVVARSEHGFVLLNNAPYNPGHAMVIPLRHVTDPRELTETELIDQARLERRTIAAIESAMGPDGFNTGRNLGDAGGGSIPHIHTHVVPRWSGDTNFMAVMDDTKIIVQALAETYDELHAAFAAQEGATVDGPGDAVQLTLD